MLSGKYKTFFQCIEKQIPAEQLITDPLRTLTFGTDASFYRLMPKIVINVKMSTRCS